MVALLQWGVLVEPGDGGLCIDGLAQLQDHANGVGALIAHIHQLGHLALPDHLSDPLHEVGLVQRIGQGMHHQEVAAADLLSGVLAAHRDRATAGIVDLLQLLAGVDDAPPGREVRALDLAAELGVGHVVLIDDQQAGIDDFLEVVGRNPGGHAHGDAFRTVHQQLRKPGGQHHRLVGLAVVIGAVVDRVLFELFQELQGDGGELGLGVAHGGRGIAVQAAEIALSIHQRVAQGEGLGHAHHGVVDRLVPVGVVLGHDLTHDGCGLAVAPVGLEVQVVEHGVQDAALHGLEAVPDIGQSAARDDGQGVGEIAPSGGLVESHRLDLRGHGVAGGRGRERRGVEIGGREETRGSFP